VCSHVNEVLHDDLILHARRRAIQVLCYFAHCRRAAPNVREDEAMGFAWSERQGQGLGEERHTAHTHTYDTVCNDQRPRDARIHHTAMGKAFVSVPSVGRAAECFLGCMRGVLLEIQQLHYGSFAIGAGADGEGRCGRGRGRDAGRHFFSLLSWVLENGFVFLRLLFFFSLGNDHTYKEA
jgi:hypothetical protein